MFTCLSDETMKSYSFIEFFEDDRKLQLIVWKYNYTDILYFDNQWVRKIIIVLLNSMLYKFFDHRKST